MDESLLWDRAGALFRYPGEDYLAVVQEWHRAVGVAEPDIASRLAHFLDRMAALSTEAQQELFTTTFDLNPPCALEVGWHLFGENYERGAFLVKMRGQLTRFGLPESGELPDHLTHVLAVLGRMPAEEAEEFAGACLLPALGKMRANLAGKSNPFESVLDAIALLIERRHGRVPGEDPREAESLRAGNGRGV
jgi:nitrate reductase delta subunit